MSQTFASNDFDSIMDSLTLFMRNQSEFKDMNFDGSAIRELLRVLAYNSQQQAFQNNFVYNELQLDTAQLRPNVTSIASRLGYTPSSMTAAQMKFNITVTPSDVTTAQPTLVLERDTKFYATKDGQTYIFSPDNPYVATLTDGKYVFTNVRLLQGIWTLNAFQVDTQYGNSSYTIPNLAVDTNTLEIAVRASETSGTQEIYNQFKTAYDIGPTAKLYFLRENRDGAFEFKFGDNKFAKRLEYGNIITVRYLVTSGASGNNLMGLTPAASIGGYYNVAMTAIDTRSYGGADSEDIDSIRTLAPITFAASGNAVTPGDYVALTKKLFPDTKDAISWGGENNVPKRYGYTFLSVIPKNSEVLSNTQKEELADLLKQYNVGSITPVIVDPVYTYINVNTTVKYRTNNLSITTASLIVKLMDYCKIFSKEKLEKFGGALDMFELSSFVNNVDGAIRSNLTNVSYEKRFAPTLDVSGSYILDFAHSIAPGSVKVTNFRIADIDSDGYVYSMIDKEGILSIIKTKGDSTVVLIDKAGKVDYAAGVVSIEGFKPNYMTDIYVKVACSSPLSDDQSLFGVRNSLLKINEVKVNLVAVTK